MTFEGLLEQTHLLVSSLIIHCHEHQEPRRLVYGKKAIPSPKVESAPPRAPASLPSAMPQKPAPLPKRPEAAPQKKEPVAIVETRDQAASVTSISAPFMQTLSCTAAKREEPHFGDLIEKIKQFSHAPLRTKPLSDLPEEALGWKTEYPHFALVSFFTRGSQEEQFLQKVAEAVASRLGRHTIFFTAPSLQTAAEIASFSSSGILKTTLLVYDLSLQQKAHDWLSLFPSLQEATQQPDIEPLTVKKKLFSTPFYQLALPPHYEETQDFKAALWKALRTVL